MSKILDNTTGAPIAISDTGVTVDNVTNYTIPQQDYDLWAASSDIITEIGSGNIIVNDGSFNLSISDGTDLIKDIFPKQIKLLGDSDGTKIGNVSDSLKVVTTPGSVSGAPVLSEKLRILSSITSFALTGSYQTVYTYTGSGIVTGFDIRFTKSDVLLKFTLDATEVVFEINTSNIETVESSFKSGTGVPVQYDSTKEVFTFDPRYPVPFTTSFKIEAQYVGGGAASNVLGYLVSHTKET